MSLVVVIKKRQRVRDGVCLVNKHAKYFAGLLNPKAQFYVERHNGSVLPHLSKKLNDAAAKRKAA